MDSGILMIHDSILVCSPDPRIPHTADLSLERAEQVLSANAAAESDVYMLEEPTSLK
jgi:hypothetical protein